jgi:hypothetical protein
MLNQDFREFIQSLNDNRVRYLVVGGYAVALHGYPRYTSNSQYEKGKRAKPSQVKEKVVI